MAAHPLPTGAVIGDNWITIAFPPQNIYPVDQSTLHLQSRKRTPVTTINDDEMDEIFIPNSLHTPFSVLYSKALLTGRMDEFAAFVVRVFNTHERNVLEQRIKSRVKSESKKARSSAAAAAPAPPLMLRERTLSEEEIGLDEGEQIAMPGGGVTVEEV